LINALKNIGLKIIVNYPYSIDDYLFDFISFLLNYKISCIRLKNGSIQCLLQALILKDSRVEHYLRFAFSSKNLMSLHCVNSTNDYSQRMECGATNGGLWANCTIFFWLAQFIKHPLEMWSSRTCKPYMNMGTKFNASEKLILTYHEGMNGHFKPITCFENMICISQTISQKTHAHTHTHTQ